MLIKAFVAFMATTQGSCDDRLGTSSPEGRLPSRGETRRGWKSRRPANRPPPPNHFLSVRIDNSHIWQEVSSLQEHILEGSSHLRPAAIPVQDLHLTLFVANWNEDGSLQRAAETLRNCGDILLELGLVPSKSDNNPVRSQVQQESHAWSSNDPNHNKSSSAGLETSTTSPDVADTVDGTTLERPTPEMAEKGTAEVPKENQSRNDDDSEIISDADERGDAGAPLELSFRGLGNFNDRVLYACLDEDEQADRFRRLARALHRRFWDAALLGVSAPDNEGGGNGDGGTVARDDKEPPRFDFTPHLTVMKTSKLEKRGVKIPPVCYDIHRDLVFGSHAPVAVELSKMREREEVPALEGFEPRPYYKCVEKIALWRSRGKFES